MRKVAPAWGWLAGWIHRRAHGIVAGATVLTLGAAILANRLEVNADLWRLLPPEYASYQALEVVRESVGGENPVEVILDGASFETMRAVADRFVPEALALRQADGSPYFVRADYRRDIAFLEANALYFATDAELDTLLAILQREARAARRQANPLTRGASQDTAGHGAIADLERALARLVGTEYPLAPDSSVMVLRLQPSSSQGDLAFVNDAVRALETLAATYRGAPGGPAIAVGGRFLQERLEAGAVVKHVRWGAAVGLPVILVLVMLYLGRSVPFRGGPWTRRGWLALVIGTPLVMSVIWTYAIAWIAFGVLNVVTTTLALVLVGMGVDYGVHWLATWTAVRRRGAIGADALAATFEEAATAVTVGALTTAAGLFTLAVADFRAFREFGVLAGTGVLLALVGALLVLPALVVLVSRGATPDPVESAPESSSPAAPWSRLAAAVMVSALALVWVGDVAFEYHASALRPEFPAFQDLRRKADRVPAGVSGGNPAIIVATDASDVPALVARLRARADTHDIIAGVEALQDRMPLTAEGQARRLAHLADVRAELDGPVLGRSDAPMLVTLRRAAATARPIPLDSVPASVLGPFTTRRGDVGRLVFVYPSRSLSDGRHSLAFAEAVGEVTLPDGRTFHAASMAIVAADMIRLMQADSRRVVVLLGAGLVVMMLATFRSMGPAALSLVPTVLGGLWLVGLMGAADLRLNLFNLAVLPVILGVGNDVGVHLVHGFRHGGWSGLAAARRRVVVATVTTGVGYGALTFTGHPGIASIGVLTVLGLGATLAAGLLIVPALLAVSRR